MMRNLLVLSLALILAIPPVFARGEEETDTQEAPVTGFEKPYVAERESLGYDPEGIEYKQNRLEDFQVVLITSAPFAALFSYGVTSLVSKLSRDTFKLDGAYSKGFLYGTAAGATAIATISVLGPKYNPPPAAALPPPPRVLVPDGPRVAVLRARF